MVNMTDNMSKIRVDLQKRIDEAMEESKGYKMEDMPTPTMHSSNANFSGSGFDKSSLTNILNAIDKESLREEKRLNKIAADAKKQMKSTPLNSQQSNLDTKSVSSMGSGLNKLDSEPSVSSKMS
jgi:tRNA A37 threonylcarbamoyltransferase TsaD